MLRLSPGLVENTNADSGLKILLLPSRASKGLVAARIAKGLAGQKHDRVKCDPTNSVARGISKDFVGIFQCRGYTGVYLYDKIYTFQYGNGKAWISNWDK